MTSEGLRRRVDAIVVMADDDEAAAHGEEDKLHMDVIRIFCPEWVRAEIERLGRAEFGRWCG